MNSFLTGKLFTHHFGGAIVFVSVNSEVKCNSTDVSEEALHTGRTQEEADTKIIVHLKHFLLNVFRNIVVKTVDTDVVTLLLDHLSLLDSPYKIEVDFNFGKDRRFYKINDICSKITTEQQLSLMFFFSLLLVVILHPRFLTYQRVLGGIYGARMPTSTKLSLN